MTQFTIESKQSFSKSKEEIIEKTKLFLLRYKFQITNENSSNNSYAVATKRGSELTLRLLGGLLISDNKLPIIMNINITDEKTIEFFFKSDLSNFGTSFGLKNKFENCFNHILFLFSNEILSD